MGGQVVIDRDKGYRKIRRSLLKQFGNVEIDTEVYVPGDPTDENSVAFYAHINEYGSADGHVPERSFIRATVTENAEKYLGATRKAVIRAIDGGAPLEPTMEAIGAHLVDAIQQRISDGIAPPNAPSTIRQKGSSTPLIDTGALRSSITHEVTIKRKGGRPLRGTM